MTVIRCMELSLTVVLSPIWQLLIPVPYDGFLHSWRLMGHVIYPQDTCFFTHPSPKAAPPPQTSITIGLCISFPYGFNLYKRTAAGFVLRCVWNTTQPELNCSIFNIQQLYTVQLYICKCSSTFSNLLMSSVTALDPEPIERINCLSLLILSGAADMFGSHLPNQSQRFLY